MTAAVQQVRRQGQMHKNKGVGSQAAYDGAYTSEQFTTTFINAGTTDGAIVSATAGSRIRVLSFALGGAAGGAGTLVFNTKPAGAGTAISPLYSLAINGSARESDINGLFQTAVGEGLTGTTSGAPIFIRVTYILVQ